MVYVSYLSNTITINLEPLDDIVDMRWLHSLYKDIKSQKVLNAAGSKVLFPIFFCIETLFNQLNKLIYTIPSFISSFHCLWYKENYSR